MRWFAVVVAWAAGCASAEVDGATPGGCPVPPSNNVVCADIEGIGVVDYGIVRAEGSGIRAATDESEEERDGINLELIPGVNGAVAAGTFRCGDEPVLIDFGQDLGSSEPAMWRADPTLGPAPSRWTRWACWVPMR